MELRDSSEGIPVNYIIFVNWSTVELPGKIGCPMSSSARMHPTLHISVGFPYILEPRRTSGDRYHLVATLVERMGESPY